MSGFIYIPLDTSMYFVSKIDRNHQSDEVSYSLSEYGKKLVSLDHLDKNHILHKLNSSTNLISGVIKHNGEICLKVRCDRSASSYARGLIRRMLKWDFVVTYRGEIPPKPESKHISLYSYVRNKKTWFVYFSNKADALLYNMVTEREGRVYDFSKKSYIDFVSVPVASLGSAEVI